MTLPRNSALILVIIGAAVASLALVSYVYGSYSSTQVSEMAAKDVESSTQRQAHDLSNVLISKVEAVDSNLGIIARSSALQDASISDSAKLILSKSQESTSGITNFYMWLDKSGHMVWLSDLSDQNYRNYSNTEMSYRPYFTEAKATNSLYYSTAINSNDKIARLCCPIWQALNPNSYPFQN